MTYGDILRDYKKLRLKKRYQYSKTKILLKLHDNL